MKKGNIKVINMFFGNTSKQRFTRAMILIVSVAIIVMLSLNISWGWDEDGKPYFRWGPAADININK